MKEEKEETSTLSRKKYVPKVFEFDASQIEHLVIFADGSVARIVMTRLVLEDHYRYFLVPTDTTAIKLNIKENKGNDPRYNQIEDHFVFDIPKKWMLSKPLDDHPVGQIHFCFSDWFLTSFINPFDNEIYELKIKTERLKRERDNHYETIKSLLRGQARNSKHMYRPMLEAVKMAGSISKETNVLAQIEKSKKGDDKND